MKKWTVLLGCAVIASIALWLTFFGASEEDQIKKTLGELAKVVAVKDGDTLLSRTARLRSRLKDIVVEDVRVDVAEAEPRRPRPAEARGRRDEGRPDVPEGGLRAREPLDQGRIPRGPSRRSTASRSSPRTAAESAGSTSATCTSSFARTAPGRSRRSTSPSRSRTDAGAPPRRGRVRRASLRRTRRDDAPPT